MSPPSSNASARRIVAGSALDPLPDALPDGRGWALFVDLDGTLCPYVDDPSTVELTPGQQETLMVLSARLDGALCILSGRAASDLDRILEGLSIARVGDHGRAPDEQPAPDTMRQLRVAEHAMRTLAATHPGLWVERKPASCALHYRRALHLADRLTTAMRVATESLLHLRLLEGNGVLETTPARSNKGHALRRRMALAPFAGRTPVAIGDDVTDEDAFVAASALGGFGIAVGPRPSAVARHRLSDTDAVDAWLTSLAWKPSVGSHRG